MTSAQSVIRSLPRSLRRQKLLAALHRLRIISPIQRVQFDREGIAWVDLRDHESRAIFLSASFWPELPPLIARFLQGGGHLFDVGAHLGLVTFGTIPFMRGLGTEYHLFEANARLIPVLQRSAAAWPHERVSIHHCCVSDRPGTSRFQLPDSCWGHGHIADSGKSVSNLLLDDHLSRHGIEYVAFMKIDVEGWEVRALRGARISAAAGRVGAGLIEVVPEYLARAGTSAGELLDLLESLGFDVYFVAMSDQPSPFRLRWRSALIDDGEPLRLAPASPLPDGFVQGDVLVLHRSHPRSSAVRAAVYGRVAYGLASGD